MPLGGTIVAVASGPGHSPRAIIRLSGPGTFAALAEVLDRPIDRAGLHRVRLGLELLDAAVRGAPGLPCLVIAFRAPRSYTGEDAAEIQVVGHPCIVRAVIDALVAGSAGAVRLALPGEFTARAFLAGKLSAEQAEGVNTLIAARTAAELDAAHRLVSGQAGEAYRALADEIASALALVEAGIDFTDQEDVVAITRVSLQNRLGGIIPALSGMIGSRAPRQRESHEPRIVLIGAPSAGKSTLFNALIGRDRSVVGESPGTTRDVIAERVDARALVGAAAAWHVPAIILIDLAGLDEAMGASGEIDRAAQAAARAEIERGDVMLWCDPTGRFTGLPSEARGKRIIRIRTKADVPGLHGDAPPDALAVCALDGWRVGALRRAIADAASAGSATADASVVLPRHRAALGAALEALEEAALLLQDMNTAEHIASPEVIASLLRRALDELGQIVGAISPDDVIGRIFATFCIGK